VESKLTRFSIGKCERTSEKGKLGECEAKAGTESLYGIFGVLIGELRTRSTCSDDTNDISEKHTGKIHRVCM
jgi:hypothetical protein